MITLPILSPLRTQIVLQRIFPAAMASDGLTSDPSSQVRYRFLMPMLIAMQSPLALALPGRNANEITFTTGPFNRPSSTQYPPITTVHQGSSMLVTSPKINSTRQYLGRRVGGQAMIDQTEVFRPVATTPPPRHIPFRGDHPAPRLNIVRRRLKRRFPTLIPTVRLRKAVRCRPTSSMPISFLDPKVRASGPILTLSHGAKAPGMQEAGAWLFLTSIRFNECLDLGSTIFQDLPLDTTSIRLPFSPSSSPRLNLEIPPS